MITCENAECKHDEEHKFLRAITQIIKCSEKSDLEKGFILGVISGIDFKLEKESGISQ
jgi:hypothetical protein